MHGGIICVSPGFWQFFQDKAGSQRTRDRLAIHTQLGELIFTDTVESRPTAHAFQPNGVAVDPGEFVSPTKNLVTATHILSSDLHGEVFVKRNGLAHTGTVRTGQHPGVGARPIQHPRAGMGGIRFGHSHAG
uniref:Uncharacterized protein n=1 Tax=mine drainage metagenome TaxID=410659 RepID=E6QEL3_9ZZZZ